MCTYTDISTLYLLSSTYTLRIVAMFLIMTLQYAMGRCVYDISNIQSVFFLLDRKAPARRSSEVLSDFVKVIVIAIICLAPVVDC